MSTSVIYLILNIQSKTKRNFWIFLMSGYVLCNLWLGCKFWVLTSNDLRYEISWLKPTIFIGNDTFRSEIGHFWSRIVMISQNGRSNDRLFSFRLFTLRFRSEKFISFLFPGKFCNLIWNSFPKHPGWTKNKNPKSHERRIFLFLRIWIFLRNPSANIWY